MKHFKRFTTLALALLMLICVMSGCEKKDGGSETTAAPETAAPAASVSLKDIVTSVTAKCPMNDVDFTYKADEESDRVLMYQYGISGEAQSAAVADFALSVPSGGISSQTFALIKFAPGTSSEIIEGVKTTLKDYKIPSLMDAAKNYDPLQYTIAEKYTLTQYGDYLVLIAYDDKGNTDVIAAVEAALNV